MVLGKFINGTVCLSPPCCDPVRILCLTASEGDAGHWLNEAILVNPRIVSMGKGKITDEEACLSFPGMGGQVRPVF